MGAVPLPVPQPNGNSGERQRTNPISQEKSKRKSKSRLALADRRPSSTRHSKKGFSLAFPGPVPPSYNPPACRSNLSPSIPASAAAHRSTADRSKSNSPGATSPSWSCGLKFLDAANIKDLLALLRFVESPRDRIAGFRLMQLVPGFRPGGLEWARLWYEPHLDRIHEDAVRRCNDFIQLKQIASDATSGEAGAPLY